MDTLNSFNKLLVVMGGGVLDDGSLPEHVVSRCEDVLWRSVYLERTLVVCSSSFTLNKPVKVNLSGIPRSEASAIAAWLRTNGYFGPVACEQQSHDTVGSVFFVLTLYASFFEVLCVEFITSDFHAARVGHIADFVNKHVFSGNFKIIVTSVPNINTTPERIAHEAHSLQQFKDMFGFVRNRTQFVECLFLRHSNYNHLFGSEVRLGEGFHY